MMYLTSGVTAGALLWLLTRALHVGASDLGVALQHALAHAGGH